MLKHQDIIENLTAEQKIIILTDEKSLFNSEFVGSSAPLLNFASLKEISQDGACVYPSAAAVANTWNLRLINHMATELGERAKGKNVNLIGIPEIKPRGHIFTDRPTEDPYYSSALSSTYLSAFENSGNATCVTNFSMTIDDAEFSDIEPDGKSLREYNFKPFFTTLVGSDCSAIEYSDKTLFGNYELINKKLVRHMMKREVAHEGSYICKRVDPDCAKNVFPEGAVLCKDGARGYLERAYNRYLDLKKSAENGIGSFVELDSAIESGEALSDERLDEWVDRTLEFIIHCNEKNKPLNGASAISAEEISQAICDESIVLLKNNSVLPIKKGTTVAVLGQLASDSNPRTPGFLEKLRTLNSNNNLQFVGAVYGYKLDFDRSEELLKAADALAQKADVLLVFLGGGEERDKRILETHVTKLPANQLALIDNLSKLGKKIIAVVSSDYCVDMSFDVDCDAVVLAPRGATHGPDALFRVLTGQTCPSGKLAASLYNNADDYFREVRTEKTLGKVKIGPFIGYRKYDSLGISCKYPFGFGLSYTNFTYSNAKIEGKGVTFTVKNTGKYDGSTVVGVYVGKSVSAVLRPKKELKGFTKIYLKAGESRQVSIALTSKEFYIYDEKIKDWSIENGVYDLYLGTDVSNIFAKLKIDVKGENINPEQRKASDYLSTNSNIVSDKFFLAPRNDFRNKNVEKTGWIFLALTGILELILGMLWYLGFHVGIALAISTLLVISAGAIMINNDLTAKKLLKKEKEKMGTNNDNSTNQHTFDQPFDQLFIEEFAEEKREEVQEEIAATQAVAKPKDLTAYFKKGLTLDKIYNDFMKFTSERGVAVDVKAAKTLISSLEASRLLVLSSEDYAVLSSLLDLLAEFFGSHSFRCDAQSFSKLGDVFFSQSSPSEPIRETAVKAAFSYAEEKPHGMHFAVLENVSFASAENYFSRFMHYVTTPQFESSLSVIGPNGQEKQIEIPSNVWFIMTTSINGMFQAPQFISEAACMINLKLTSIYPSEVLTSPTAPSVHQFTQLAIEAQNKTEIGEDVWKKVDKLENYVRSRTNYKIGNKQWLRMERFVSVYNELGGEEKEALDCLVTVKLLISMLNALATAEKDENDETDISQILESAFGEENIVLSQNVVKQAKLAGII